MASSFLVSASASATSANVYDHVNDPCSRTVGFPSSRYTSTDVDAIVSRPVRINSLVTVIVVGLVSIVRRRATRGAIRSGPVLAASSSTHDPANCGNVRT
jgi:hypothetical protein